MSSVKKEWLTTHRTAIFVVLNVGVLLLALIGGPLHGIDTGRGIYAFLLFLLCSVPLLSLSALNGRFFLLAVFMAFYFLIFGALDLQALLMGEEIHPAHEGFLEPAEVAILSGALMVLLGYFAGVGWGSRGQDLQPPKEWPKHTIAILGVTLWVVGIAAVIYFQVFTIPEKSNAAAARGFAAMGPMLTFIVMLGHLLGPLGVLILAYGYARFRGLHWLVLILLVVASHVVVGFISDIKAEAMMGGVIVILVKTLVDNRLPRAWLAGGLAFIILAFPVFQAYRVEVAGERGLNRLQALKELPKVLAIAISARDKVSTGHPGARSQTFLERSSSKGNIEILMSHAGVDTPFLHGRTLVAIPMAFVPRLIAPDKEDISVGQLFTKQILKSGSDTYISISHLGELYWNFGWLGIFAVLPLTGFLLGTVGGRSSLETRLSMTRLLMLMATVQPLCLGFGGTMPVSYVIWLRSTAAIGLLHVMFARRVWVARPADASADPRMGSRADSSEAADPMAAPAPAPARYPAPLVREPDAGVRLALPPPRFPNLLR